MANRMSGENLVKLYKAGKRDFQNMNLSRISLKNADLREANFQGANLQGANLQRANLQGANLEGADLKNANLEEADLVGAKLEGANLEGANLKWVWFEKLSGEDYALKYESNIVWLKDISKIDYVRPGFDIFYSRKGEIKDKYKDIVGYGELEDDAPPYWRMPRQCFSRRYFWLKKEDRLHDPKGVYRRENDFGNHPSEAIDPLSVVKKCKGEVTDRVKGIQNTNQILYEEKIAKYTLTINNNHSDDKAYSNRANVYYKLGYNWKAIEDCTLSISLNPNNSKAYFNRGNAYHRIGNIDNAIDDYTQVIKLKSNYDKDAYYLRGILRNNIGDRQGGIEDLKKSAQLFFELKDLDNYQIIQEKIRRLNVNNHPDNAELENTQVLPKIIESSSSEIETPNQITAIEKTPDSDIENFIVEQNEEISAKLSPDSPQEIDEITTAQEQLEEEEFFTPKTIKEAKERITISIARRQGQSKFRQTLLEIYNNRCAISGCDAQEALEAAHIIPYIETVNNDPSNGLLLRGDLHTLFDLNLITINPETMQIYLAPSLRHTSYGELHEKPLQLPKNQAYWPKKEYLKWRCEQCDWYI